MQPINVAPPSQATFVSQPSQEHSKEPNFMITSDSDEDEQPTQWFRPGFLNKPLSSSSPFVLESIHDLPYVPAIEVSTSTIIDLPSSSTQTCPPVQTTNVSFPPTLLLDSTILQKVCENIFKDLNKLVKTRNNLVHENDYVDEWTRLRIRVDNVMCELEKTSLEAHDKAVKSLNEWFSEVVKNMEHVETNRKKEKSKLYISDTPIFLDASEIISSSMHSENLDLKWLSKLKVDESII